METRVSYNGERCVIRYRGEVQGTKGDWLGVEWDDAARGKHNGEAGGVRYFHCQSKGAKPASFIRPTRPSDPKRTFIEALRFKYASEHMKISFQIGGPPVEKPIRISGKEAEEIGFDKISKKLADLHELRVVLLDGLNVFQPLDERLFDSWTRGPQQPRERISHDIREICPKITELDLSRNLFGSFHEVVAICDQLENVRTLRLDGNRFGPLGFSKTEKAHFRVIFAKVESLSLENTLLTWAGIVLLCSVFPALKTLSISSNEMEKLDPEVSQEGFPPIATIKLESNEFMSMADLAPLAKLSSLRTLVLKNNPLAAMNAPGSGTPRPIFSTIADLDVSYNSIADWSFINDLNTSFPSLTALRISHNPLYTNLHSPAGRELTPDDGYMLTIARLPRLRTLNYSTITEKDRLNAESYYLSMIAQELALRPESDAKKILEKHPRWQELCEEYGEPEVKREKDHVDPRSLAARLLTLEFELSDAASIFFQPSLDRKSSVTLENIPKRFNVYSVLGMAVKAFGQSYVPLGISLSLITDEWVEEDGERKRREVKLVPETRGIGTFVEGRMGRVRIDYAEPVKVEGYKHPMDFELLTGQPAAVA